VLLTNLTAIFKLSKLSLKGMMKKRWGRIISIGSVVGSSGNPGQTNYCAAKSGLIGFSKSLAIEVASRNITVNVVSPGFIKTDMTDVLTNEQKEKTLSVVPSGRMGDPKDISSAVCFLARENSGYITGNTLHVNGGMYMA
jgi:3-oxoacyl-[acyl-carrier protein] reductase